MAISESDRQFMLKAKDKGYTFEQAKAALDKIKRRQAATPAPMPTVEPTGGATPAPMPTVEPTSGGTPAPMPTVQRAIETAQKAAQAEKLREQSPTVAGAIDFAQEAKKDITSSGREMLENRSPAVSSAIKAAETAAPETKEIFDKKILHGEAPTRPGLAIEEGIDKTIGQIPIVGGALAGATKLAATPLTSGLDIGAKTIEGAKEGLGTVAEAGTQAGEAIFGIDTETGKKLTPSERVIKGGGALGDLLGGSMETIFSPITAAIDELPDTPQKIVEYPFEKINQASAFAGNKFNEMAGIDPNSEQGQVINKLFGVLGQLLPLKVAQDVQAGKKSIAEGGAAKAYVDPIIKMQEAASKTAEKGIKIVKENMPDYATVKQSTVEMANKLKEDLGNIKTGLEKKSIKRTTRRDVASILKEVNKTAKEEAQIQKYSNGYREILRPEKGEIKNIESKSGKNIDDMYRLAAEEQLTIRLGPDKKLDTKVAIEQLEGRQPAIHKKLNEILESKPGKNFDLQELKSDAQAKLRKEIKNDTEYKAALKEMDQYINDAISERGRFLTGREFNEFKQSMWEVSYDQMRPTSKTTAQEIGNVVKEKIEKAYPDAQIKKLNKLSGDYATLKGLLKNANGRVVQGGRLGKYFAQIAGGVIGSAVPIFGSVGGYLAGGKLLEYLTNPERASKKLSKGIEKLGAEQKSFKELIPESL